MALSESSRRVINPMAEDAYWRIAFTAEPYYRAQLGFDDYSPAFRVGYTGPLRREGSFAQLEPLLEQDWLCVKGRSRLQWNEAKHAARAAWLHATQAETRSA